MGPEGLWATLDAALPPSPFSLLYLGRQLILFHKCLQFLEDIISSQYFLQIDLKIIRKAMATNKQPS